MFLSLGTNIGDRVDNLRYCIDQIKMNYKIKKISSIYETEPWGVTEQDAFLNMCIEIESQDDAIDMLQKFKLIEKEMGRIKKEKWGPRLIDIDILYIDDLIFESDRLNIPHEGIYERAFVLVPLNEIAANFVDPTKKETIHELLSEISSDGVKKYLDKF